MRIVPMHVHTSAHHATSYVYMFNPCTYVGRRAKAELAVFVADTRQIGFADLGPELLTNLLLLGCEQLGLAGELARGHPALLLCYLLGLSGEGWGT